MTAAGVLLGTAAYMSPEQARGRAVDKRTDIWAFGAVLNEMLTGRRAFPGDDVSDVLASVLAREPDWTVLPDHVPPGGNARNQAMPPEGLEAAASRHRRRVAGPFGSLRE